MYVCMGFTGFLGPSVKAQRFDMATWHHRRGKGAGFRVWGLGFRVLLHVLKWAKNLGPYTRNQHLGHTPATTIFPMLEGI